jgi:hypothetical protein
MATYLSLTNELLRRLNEVQMDSTEFSTARNVQSLAKDAVNSSIRELMHSAQEWPFVSASYTQTLTTNVGTYLFPVDMSSIDWDSFYLQKLTAQNNVPKKIPYITYISYIETQKPKEDQTGTSGQAAPLYVYDVPNNLSFGVTPLPNAAYNISYNYFYFPADLTNATDVCVVPDRFKNVLIDGAMMYMMIFRSNEQSATIHKGNFESGIKVMRRLLIGETNLMRSTAITQTTSTARVF